MATGKKTKRVIEAEGIAHVSATFNNTTITITDTHGQHDLVGLVGQGRLQGLQEVARRSPRPSPASRPDARRVTLGVRRVHVRVQGPGSGPRVGHPGARRRWSAGQVDPGRHADSAQRLPSPEASESLSHGRYTGPSCRQCRREGTKLFLKGTKCFTEKCPVERRPYAAGPARPATARRRKMSEYSKQLREKQKIKRIYGVSEKQFRNTFERVAPLPGHHGTQPARRARESRLDNVVYRMGFAAQPQGGAPAHSSPSRRGQSEVASTSRATWCSRARKIRVRMKSREQASRAWRRWISRRAARRSRGSPSTRTRSAAGCSRRPTRPNIPIAAQEQLVVELYSK